MKHHKVLCSKEFRERMEKSVTIMGKHLNREFWFVLIGSFFLLYAIFVLSGHYSGFTVVTNKTSFIFTNDPLAIGETEETLVSGSKDKTEPVSEQPGLDLCTGKYIYVHDLPSRFNEDIIRNCSSLVKWFDMCTLISNMGLGPLAKNSNGVLQNQSWHETNQFVLEIIFHNRMKKYKCLTNDSSLASAIYVPFYAGLDVGRYLFGNGLNTWVRDALPLDLVKWLRGKPEWNYMMGKDHFFVCGRITWDFRRRSDNVMDWGNKLLMLPEAKNMTVLGIESSPWTDQEFSIPYPTYFHPLSDDQVFDWQNKVRRRRRPYLFSFVGAPRPNLEGSIRSMIINQCLASGRKCKLLDCSSNAARNCHEPVHVMKMFQRAVFCLQPPGDSYTRRSIFDSILAGCIPVFFHPESAYDQYKWHLPANHTKYSVFIPEDMVKEGKAKIGKILDGIPRLQVSAMREEVIKLIPRVVYADPSARLENLEDAFDIAVSKVLERVEYIRRDMKLKYEEI